jgi:Domain of unknown function (DUF4349)
MNTRALARSPRGRLRCTASRSAALRNTVLQRTSARCAALAAVAAFSCVGLLVAGCASSAPSASSGSAAAGSNQPEPAGVPAGPGAGSAATSAARLVPASQSIVYTASLTVQVAGVRAAANRATEIATSAGGYTAGERESARPGHAPASASLQLKIPVAAYPAALQRLSADLGRQTSLTQRATDVTGQVADVSSRVTSARDAISQLRTLLRRAGSVSGLLSVQDQINAQESSLEALQARQRALTREVSYATVSLRLLSKPRRIVASKKARHGFTGGLASGWRGLRAVISWLLTALGVILPFAAVLALVGGIGYWVRRRLRRGSRTPAAD